MPTVGGECNRMNISNIMTINEVFNFCAHILYLGPKRSKQIRENQSCPTTTRNWSHCAKLRLPHITIRGASTHLLTAFISTDMNAHMYTIN